MTAVILAGGKGSRLRPLTTDLPKPLVKIGDRSILEVLLRRMADTGVHRVHLAVNHLADQIEAVIGDGQRFGLECRYSRETQPLSTIGPLRLIPGLPEDFLVANGDILTDLDFGRLFETHLQSGARLTIAVYRRDSIVDFGVIETNNDGLVSGFEEKPRSSLTVSMGLYVLSSSLIQTIPADQPYGFDQLVSDMLSRGEPIATHAHYGYWLDIGRPEDYLQAQKDIDQIEGLLRP
ncbi:MAG: sugar phosphate nucleotidyltransferase [bacterium]